MVGFANAVSHKFPAVNLSAGNMAYIPYTAENV